MKEYVLPKSFPSDNPLASHHDEQVCALGVSPLWMVDDDDVVVVFYNGGCFWKGFGEMYVIVTTYFTSTVEEVVVCFYLHPTRQLYPQSIPNYPLLLHDLLLLLSSSLLSLWQILLSLRFLCKPTNIHTIVVAALQRVVVVMVVTPTMRSSSKEY